MNQPCTSEGPNKDSRTSSFALSLMALILFPVMSLNAQDGNNLVCPPVEVVFAMDTSGSMNDEAAALCSSISAVQSDLTALGVVSQTYLFGITEFAGQGESVNGPYSCLTNSVANFLGSAIPGDGTACTSSGQLNQSESWGEAVAIAAQNFPWAPGAVRVVVPISDEAACRGGSSCSQSDIAALNNASVLSVLNDVVVSPIAGTGSNQCVIDLGASIATATGGTPFISQNANLDLAGAVRDLIISACQAANNPPQASCQDVTVAADGSCQGNASVNNGTSDADGDPLIIVESPAGPYGLGSTTVELTATDTENASDSCSGVVTVVDSTPPTLSCNSVAALTILDSVNASNLPVSYTGSVTDNCSQPAAPTISNVTCSSNEGAVDTTSECDVTINGSTITINATGSSTQVAWTLASLGDNELPITTSCAVSLTPAPTPTPTAEPTPTPTPEEEPELSVECSPTDSTETLLAIDGNAFSQRAIGRRLSSLLQRRGGKRSSVRSLRGELNETYTESWTATWSNPPQTLSCQQSALCSVSSLSENVSQSLEVNEDLYEIVLQIANRLKKQSGGKLRKRDRKLIQQSVELFEQTQQLHGTLPQQQTTCGGGTTILLN